MSIYDFYPMKKRRICKTPNGGRTASTLGKLKKTSDQLATAGDSGIEVLWDNNSPSPTTTLALAGKRRRKCQNNSKNGRSGTTDISFVVQKLSENTSPVVDNHSTLLEMWVGKDDGNNEHDEEFTSPPNQIRQPEKSNIPVILSTPLNKRSRTTKKKASRQFMLEVRKLVDEIQNSDLGSSGSQRNSQSLRENQLQRKQEDINSTTNVQKPQTSTQIVPEINIAPTNSVANDSFEWTEDDMDEFILTCQLSSSGKGTLDEPCYKHTKPQFGLSPSSILVEESQVLFDDTFVENQEPPVGPSHNAAEKMNGDGWEMNFGDDDSLLESAAQEFELSQQTAPKQTLGATVSMLSIATKTHHAPNGLVAKPAHFTKLCDKDIQLDVRSHTPTSVSKTAESVSTKEPGESTGTKSTVHVGSDQKPGERLTEVSGKTTNFIKMSGGNLLANQHEQSMLCQRSGEHLVTKKPGKIVPTKMVRKNNGLRESIEGGSIKKTCFNGEKNSSSNNKFSLPSQKSNGIPNSKKSDENFESNRRAQFNTHSKTSSKSPLKGRSGNLTSNKTKPDIFNSSNNSAHSLKQSDKSCTSGNSNLKNSATASSKVSIKSVDENEINCLLSEENLDALLEDFNFEDMFFDEHSGSSTNTKTCKTSKDQISPIQATLPTRSTATKTGCTEQEIERKRLEAQRRRLAKRQAAPKYKRERTR